MTVRTIPVRSVNEPAKQELPWEAIDLRQPRPFRAAFPVLLDGDLVMSPEHLGVAYLISVLEEAGAECLLVEVARGGLQTRAIEQIAEFDPDLVGITLTTVGVDHATSFGAELRERIGKEIFVVAGGALATHLGDRLMRLDAWRFLDGVVRGEGEIPIVQLAAALQAQLPIHSVPNLTWRDSEGELQNNLLTKAVHDLNDIPYPSRQQFELHGGRLSPSFSYLRVSTSRGCTSFCTFCNAPHARNRVAPGKPWRGCTPEHIVDEIEYLVNKYDAHTFDFVDSTFEDPGGTKKAKQRVEAIAREIIDRGLKIYFNCCMQAVNWSDDDRPLLQLLYRSGLEKVLVGVEGGSDVELERWKKRARSADNTRTIALLREHNIYVAFGFIFFHPHSTFETLRDNHRFLVDNMGHNLRRFTTRLELYPGAEVVEQLREDGLLRPSYDAQLDPFGYVYEDQRIGDLARFLNSFWGGEYVESGVIEEEPIVFEFETFDIVLHTFYSRLLRELQTNVRSTEIVRKGIEDSEAVRARLTRANADFIGMCIDAAEVDGLGDLSPNETRRELEATYASAIRGLRSIQMSTSMALHRSGLDVRKLVAAS